MNAKELAAAIKNGSYDDKFTALYGAEAVPAQQSRYIGAVEAFASLFGAGRDISLFSVPGRSEISGNHTDHNRGRVIAAAVNLDIIAAASKNEDGVIRIKSEGFPQDTVNLGALDPSAVKKYDSSAIVAGMCDGFKKNGYNVGAFDAYTTSDVLKGSGLSSSAAFEVMTGNILNHFYNGGAVPAPEIAKIAQYSENVFFGKPCGLMDQTACAVGGFVAIDFADPKNPVIEKLDFSLADAGYSLCIVNTGGSHADLNDDYASIPAEMKAVASYFGREALRGLSEKEVIGAVPALRGRYGDRAVLRALHFIAENERVAAQTEALRKGELGAFLEGVTESGRSSFMWLQNVYSTKNPSEQGVSLALRLAQSALKDCPERWAVRVHGGGFAGTIQAFVPNPFIPNFKSSQESAFGPSSCSTLAVRASGACRL